MRDGSAHSGAMSTPRRVALALGVAVLVAGAGALAYALTRDTVQDIATPPPAATSSTAPAGQGAAGPAPAERLRVVDLMTRAGCPGNVIDTQLYSYETGRCQHPAGGEVTVAVFDTDALRDQWVEVGRGFGGTIVVGDGWAAGVDRPDAAEQLATALGGRLV